MFLTSKIYPMVEDVWILAASFQAQDPLWNDWRESPSENRNLSPNRALVTLAAATSSVLCLCSLLA